jgi:hypothetical protein
VTAAALLALALVLNGPGDLKLIGALELPKTLVVDGAPLGGISGVDYDRGTGRWLMISDDRSEKAPARFFVGRLDYDARSVRGLRLERQVPLRREDGSTFPPTASPAGERADAEALRLDPLNGDLVWSTEGDAARGFDPAVRRMGRDGEPKAGIPTPLAFRFDPAKTKGPRPNLTFEGLSFSPDGRSLWLSMEAPLIQDGPVSSVAAGGLTRITRLDRKGRVEAQYAYRLDPVQAAPARRGDNGISEILAVDDHRLLVLERSGVERRERGASPTIAGSTSWTCAALLPSATPAWLGNLHLAHRGTCDWFVAPRDNGQDQARRRQDSPRLMRQTVGRQVVGVCWLLISTAL